MIGNFISGKKNFKLISTWRPFSRKTTVLKGEFFRLEIISTIMSRQWAQCRILFLKIKILKLQFQNNLRQSETISYVRSILFESENNFFQINIFITLNCLFNREKLLFKTKALSADEIEFGQ